MYLQCLFIQRGRNETTWAVLRKFGYDNDLKMCKEYIHPQWVLPPDFHQHQIFHYYNFTSITTYPFFCRLKVPLGCTTELSHKGNEFLALLFMQHDRDRDGALSPSELESLFSRCPSQPWGDEYKHTVVTNEKVMWYRINESRVFFIAIDYWRFKIQ